MMGWVAWTYYSSSLPLRTSQPGAKPRGPCPTLTLPFTFDLDLNLNLNNAPEKDPVPWLTNTSIR